MGIVCQAYMSVRPGVSFFVWFILAILVLSSPAPAQSQSPLTMGALQTALSQEPGQAAPVTRKSLEESFTWSGNGILDGQRGGTVAGARMHNMSADQSPFQHMQQSSPNYSLADPAPWRFQLVRPREGFAALPFGPLHHSQKANIGSESIVDAPMAAPDPLAAATNFKLAKHQARKQRAPRALGFVPNYYVAYVHNAAPLTVRQKFNLAWNSVVDPFTFGLSGALAGIQQARNDYDGFGQGAQGYAKRFGAFYAGHITGTFFESALLPSLLKQDPRYFYKGMGSKRGRLLYAIANSVICEGDNRRWQTNYSNILGNIAASTVSNFYHPPQNRDGVGRILLNALIGIGASAGLNIVQEFFTPRLISVLPGQPMNKP